MAGGRNAGKGGAKRPTRPSGSKAKARSSRRRQKGAAEYTKEAVAEWRKAARLAMAAWAPKKGERAGDAVDALLAKLGPPGKLVSKVGLGSRIVERLRPASGAGSAGPQAAELGANGNGRPSELRVPIQESIEIAVPLSAAYALAVEFEGYPRFLEHAESVRVLDQSSDSFETNLRGRGRTIEIDILHRTREARTESSGNKTP